MNIDILICSRVGMGRVRARKGLPNLLYCVGYDDYGIGFSIKHCISKCE